jgi:hypothetical protein
MLKIEVEMSIEEQIEHKKVQMIYLRKLLEREQEEIDVLELQKPPLLEEQFAKEKAAFKAGKRIAWRYPSDEWYLCLTEPSWVNTNEYKIVPNDEYQWVTISKVFEKMVAVKFTKCGLTGKETVEILK